MNRYGKESSFYTTVWNIIFIDGEVYYSHRKEAMVVRFIDGVALNCAHASFLDQLSFTSAGDILQPFKFTRYL